MLNDFESEVWIPIGSSFRLFIHSFIVFIRASGAEEEGGDVGRLLRFRLLRPPNSKRPRIANDRGGLSQSAREFRYGMVS